MTKYNAKLRRRLSYLLFPAMVIFTFNPSFAYASLVYVGGKGNVSRSNSASDFSVNRKAASKLKTAKAVNKFNKANKAAGATNDDKPSPSSSNATNYTMGIGATVNPQTGQLQVNLNNVSLPGTDSDFGINFGLSNGGGSKSIYNLPIGWKFNIPYIDITATPNYILHLDSSQNYTIDSTFKSLISPTAPFYSGLRYSTSEAVSFKDLQQTEQLPSKYGSKQLYQYIVALNTGGHYYFDSDGKLICKDEANGNYILYNYQSIDGSPDANAFDVRVTSITECLDKDSSGNTTATQTVTIKDGGAVPCNNVTITLPPDRNNGGKQSTIKYAFTSGQITATDVTGRTAELILQTLPPPSNETVVTEIDYPAGARTVYSYNARIPYDGGSFPAIDSVKTYCDLDSSNPAMETDYNYTPSGSDSHSFAGPNPYSSTNDSLMETPGDEAYTYVTQITQKRTHANGGDVVTKQTFNFLHLPISTEVSQGTHSTLTTTKYQGEYDQSGNYTGTFVRPYNGLYCNDEKPANVATAIDGNKTPVNEVMTKYNNYSQPTKVTQVTKKEAPGESGYINVSKIVKTFTYFPYNPAASSNSSYCQLKNSILTDTTYLDSGQTTTQTTTTNTLGGDGTYIATSTIKKENMNDKNAKPSSRETTTSEDPCGRVLAITYADPGSTANGPSSTNTSTTYSLKDNNLTAKTTDALGYETSKTVDTVTGKVISETKATDTKYEETVNYQYDDNGLIVTKKYPDGSWLKTDSSNLKQTVITYSNGRKIVKNLDGLGRLVNESDSLYPGAYQGYIEQNTYNKSNKVASKIDMYGHKTTYIYDDLKGRMTDSVDYLGNTTHIDYNDAGLTSTTLINKIPVRITYYDNDGKVIGQKDLTSGIGDSCSESVSTYNGEQQEIGNTLEMVNESSNDASAGTPLMSTTTTYDINGKPDTIQLTGYSDQANGGSVVTAHAQDSRDIFGNLENKTITFDTADSSQNIVKDTAGYPDGKITSEKKTYDNDGQLTSLIKADGSAAMSYTYNADGKVAKMTDFAGNTFTYNYDCMGNMTSMTGAGITRSNTYYPGNDTTMDAGLIHTGSITYPDGQTDTITYGYNDGRGNLTDKTMNGITMHITYDGFNRVQSITDFDGKTTTYKYNEGVDFKAQDPGTAGNSVMSISNDDLGSAVYTYCAKTTDGPLFGYGTTIKNAAYKNADGKTIETVNYAYYGQNNDSNATAKLKAPKLESIETLGSDGSLLNETYYQYDSQDRVTTLITTSKDSANLNCYNEKDFKYNSMNQLTEEDIHLVDPTVGAGQTLKTTKYWYDVNGNIVSRVTTDSKSGQVTSDSYTYNGIDQLTKWVSTPSNGTAVTKTFDYDVNGNMLDIKDGTKTLQTFIYYPDNKIKEFYIGDNKENDTHYDYNAEGLRKDKYFVDQPDRKLVFFYTGNEKDGYKLVNSELTVNGAVNAMSAYLIAGGKRVVRAINYTDSTQSPELQWYISNGKDVVGIANADGTGYAKDASGNDIVYNYTPYGKDENLNG